MNPQLFQSIKLMALPVVDLRERIQEEIERNPALEVV
jgi:RNA polymerase sigma-54 factor